MSHSSSMVGLNLHENYFDHLLKQMLGEAIFQIVLENPLLAIGQKLGIYIHRTLVVNLIQHNRRLHIPDPACVHDSREYT